MRFSLFMLLLVVPGIVLLGESLPLQEITREEALTAAYPGARIEAERLFLSGSEVEEVENLAGVGSVSALVARYLAWNGEDLAGRAYIDTHLVRTKKESLLICLNADGSVKRIEVTAFQEPPEYQASPLWYRQYSGRELNDELQLNRGIRPLAGATLTAAAANAAVRRVLALDRVLERRGR